MEIIKQIAKYKRLLDAGVLTKEEYDRKKAQLFKQYFPDFENGTENHTDEESNEETEETAPNYETSVEPSSAEVEFQMAQEKEVHVDNVKVINNQPTGNQKNEEKTPKSKNTIIILSSVVVAILAILLIMNKCNQHEKIDHTGENPYENAIMEEESADASTVEPRSERILRYERLGKRIISNEVDSSIVFISGDTIYVDQSGVIKSIVMPNRMSILILHSLKYNSNSQTIEFNTSGAPDVIKKDLDECNVRALGCYGLEYSHTSFDEMVGDESTTYYIYLFSKPNQIYSADYYTLLSTNNELANGLLRSSSYGVTIDNLVTVDSEDWYTQDLYNYCKAYSTINLKEGTMRIEKLTFLELDRTYTISENNQFKEAKDYLSLVAKVPGVKLVSSSNSATSSKDVAGYWNYKLDINDPNDDYAHIEVFVNISNDGSFVGSSSYNVTEAMSESGHVRFISAATLEISGSYKCEQNGSNLVIEFMKPIKFKKYSYDSDWASNYSEQELFGKIQEYTESFLLRSGRFRLSDNGQKLGHLDKFEF